MGKLKIRRVLYSGDKYFYESPLLKDGVNIIEAANEHGKSTFMNLIYYGLGGKVKSFENGSTEKHAEIFSDTNNSVTLIIEIDDERYELIRSIGSNKIYIVNSAQEVIESFVNRRGNNFVFSDWILDKLSIKVFDIYQGASSNKVGFSDLLRLMYHDQMTEIDRIYKAPDNDVFFTDSLIIRKAIFEVLMGQTFDEYYDLLGRYKSKRKEYEEVKAILKSYDDFVYEIIEYKIENTKSVEENLSKSMNKIKMLEDEKKRQINKSISTEEVIEVVDDLKGQVVSIEKKLIGVTTSIKAISKSIDKILHLIDYQSMELKEIEKIRFFNSKLKLFSPNTCPYCLNEVEREEGKCICGNHIDENEYEKFFYTDDEYLEIIQSKNKGILSLKEVLKEKQQRKKSMEFRAEQLSTEATTVNREIGEILKDISPGYNSSIVNRLDNAILEEKSKLIDYKKAIEISGKKEELSNRVNATRMQVEKLEKSTNKALLNAQKDMQLKRELFNQIYLEFMRKADKNCFDAYISEDYMPYVNGQQYRARSTSVPKRLMYFVTLLKMSVTQKTSHPGFLLVDTPNKEGIDRDNLERNIDALKLFDVDNVLSSSYQIIISTGLETYPNDFSRFVFQTLKEEKKLLIKK